MMRILSEIVVTLSASPALSLLVKGTLVLALALISARLARRSRAAVRHALLASGFSVLLALPIVSFFAKPFAISVPVAAAVGMVPPLPDVIPVSSSGATAAAGSGAARADSGWSLPPLSTTLLFGWLIGTVFFLIPVISGLRQIRSLRRYSVPWRQGQSVADALASGVRSRVDVLLHESLSGPMTCGFLHPAVILPVDVQSWNEEDLARAFVHELEHVRRYDWAVHCFARIACALYWFHPLVWIAWRRLGLEAERSCDDAVLRGSEPTAYADQLVGLARRRILPGAGKSPALAMADRSDLAARIGALLDRGQARGRAGALLVTGACLAAAALVLTISPLRMVAAPKGNRPAIGLLDVSQVRAQSAENLTFDVASVKLHPGVADRNTLVPPTVLPGGRFVSRMPLAILISFAYKNARMTGIPDWTKTPQGVYDVEATSAMPPGLSMQARDDRVRAMVQALLADRFKLVIRRESKEMPVYALVVAKGGPKLQRADIDEKDCPEASLNALGPQSTSTPMPDVCHVF